MMAGTAVIARARLCNAESFFCLLPLRGETAGRGGLGVRRSRGARGGIELSGADRRRRPFVHSKKSILRMKTAFIDCAEANFLFVVAICIVLS